MSNATLSTPLSFLTPCPTLRLHAAHHHPVQQPRTRHVYMRVPQHPELQTNLQSWGVTIDPSDTFGSRISPVSIDPPLLRIENFLTDAQCDALIALQDGATDESDLYLNYRVNKEVNSSAASTEAEKLIEEFSSSQSTLDASMRSGFRAQIPPESPELVPVMERTRALLGFEDREFVFEEGIWRRPNRRTVMVRDQTTVRYNVGEGVAPHVDGNDVTVLICLKQPEQGGRTVFPEDGLAVVPMHGAAIVYRSKKELLHFAEAVTQGQKWVLQLLIDFHVRDDEPDVDFATGKVFQAS